MNVHGPDHPSAVHFAPPPQADRRNAPTQVKSPANPARPDAPPAEHKPETKAHLGQGDPGGGVLAGLEAGHFKGVADVRLRINFHEALTARADAAAREALGDQADPLVESLQGKANELIAAFAGDDETRQAAEAALDTLQTAIRSAVESAANDEGLDERALTDRLQSAFDTFVKELRVILTPAEPEPVPADEADLADDAAGGVKPTDPETDAGVEDSTAADPATTEPTATPSDEEPTLDQALDELAGFFDAALTEFLASVDTSSRLLAPLSQPTGNGGAYESFLALYNELQNGAAGLDATG